ncbi:hypothetical protein [Streptococcus ruminantium]|uniref:hypothetical protein n=1 Tax=Streptococcus ruminantium TaxID=1917441 RepID=UPI0012DE9B3A|nr:hypothetical protein [Streptococcus ruminantium]
MEKFAVNAHFFNRATKTFVEEGAIFEADAKRAKEINDALSDYAKEKGVESILSPLKKTKKKDEEA